MNELIKQLIARGHSVTWYKRKDGGVRIRSIDGTHYSGSTGNKVARWMLGQQLSEAKARQLESIRTPKGQWGHKKKSAIPEDLQKMLNRQQRRWRKQGKKKGDQGMPSKKGLRYVLEHEGEEEARRSLIENERYRLGLAYTKNVEWLISRIERESMNSDYQDEWIELADYIDSMKNEFREAWIQAIYELLGSPPIRSYASMSEEDKINAIYSIIK